VFTEWIRTTSNRRLGGKARAQANSVGGVTNHGLNALHHALSGDQDYIAFNSWHRKSAEQYGSAA
jgi:hypothetical protein